MRAIIAASAALILSACAGGARSGATALEGPAPALSFDAPRKAAVIIVFRFEQKDGTAREIAQSGVAVGPEHVLTSAARYRAAEGEHRETAVFALIGEEPLKLEASAPVMNDKTGLMLLRTKPPAKLSAWATLSEDGLSLGAEVRAAEFLLYQGAVPGVLTRGTVSSVETGSSGATIVQMPVHLGTVGSGIYDGRGRLSGIVVSLVKHQDRDGEYDPDRCVAADSRGAFAFLKANGL